MPALPFQSRLKPAILNGTKPGTVRQVRKKNPIKPGDTLYHFTGMRTKKCKKFYTNKCVKVYNISISCIQKKIWIEGVELTPTVRHMFAVTDIQGPEILFWEFFNKQNYNSPLVYICWSEETAKAIDQLIPNIKYQQVRLDIPKGGKGFSHRFFLERPYTVTGLCVCDVSGTEKKDKVKLGLRNQYGPIIDYVPLELLKYTIGMPPQDRFKEFFFDTQSAIICDIKKVTNRAITLQLIFRLQPIPYQRTARPNW